MTVWYFVFLIAPAANAQLHVSAMAAITGGTCSLQSVQDESHMDMNVTTAHMKDRLVLTINDYYSENNGYGLDSHRGGRGGAFSHPACLPIYLFLLIF